MSIYYVYALVDPRTELEFYIGKGKGDSEEDSLRAARKRVIDSEGG